jgi:hypothetical protein
MLERKHGLDHRFGQFPTAGRPRQGVFGRAAGCLSDSGFLPIWKKYPGVADTMIKAENTVMRGAPDWESYGTDRGAKTNRRV